MSPFARRLLTWYRRHARTLPWRNRRDPYAVWVSEIMLQQTRVETAIPYFKRWLKRFPTIQSLAQASEQDVLNLWEGLGYYARARNLHTAAKIVVEKYHGHLPRDLTALRRLPGIGRYSAGAIASMAFGLDEPALDANIRRVFARVFDISVPVESAAGEETLWQLVAAHLPKGRAGAYNQALMDLGATVCAPKEPHCSICPVRGLCQAQARGIQDQRPVLKPRKKTPHYFQGSAVVIKNGRVLLAKRPATGLLGGLWEFPNARVAGDPAVELARALRTALRLKVRPRQALGVVRHAYSHFSVTVYPFRCELASAPVEPSLKWVKVRELENYPMGGIDRQIARQLC
ncbi:MAG TPA: A/G-specific adenine glycosylase [Anaerolineales bacterium]|nr:A/G-specific adenine glycosylase [Anaerolineales bacterium]